MCVFGGVYVCAHARVHVHTYGGQPIQTIQGAESIVLLSQIQKMRYK